MKLDAATYSLLIEISLQLIFGCIWARWILAPAILGTKEADRWRAAHEAARTTHAAAVARLAQAEAEIHAFAQMVTNAGGDPWIKQHSNSSSISSAGPSRASTSPSPSSAPSSGEPGSPSSTSVSSSSSPQPEAPTGFFGALGGWWQTQIALAQQQRASKDQPQA